MGPTVHGVDVHPQQAQECKLPSKEAEQSPHAKEAQRDEHGEAHRFPQGDPRDVTRSVVVEDVFVNRPTDKWR